MFLISTKNTQDKIDIHFEDTAAIFDVNSPGGIGSATIELESGTMPQEIIVRLHMQGLEDFRITSAQNAIKASISSSDPPHVNIQETGSEAPILPSDPLWLKIEIVSDRSDKKIPLEEGYFEVTLPTEFIQQAHDAFSMEWIDFYR